MLSCTTEVLWLKAEEKIIRKKFPWSNSHFSGRDDSSVKSTKRVRREDWACGHDPGRKLAKVAFGLEKVLLSNGLGKGPWRI